MAAVPCQNVIHTVDGSNGNKDGVFRRALRDQPVTEKTRHEKSRVGRERKNGEPFQRSQAARGRFRIARSRLSEHPRRNVEAEPVAVVVPPVARQLLMRGNQEVAARTRRQIARDCGFQVDLCLGHNWDTVRY